MVRTCLEDRRMQSGEGKARTSIIDHLLQDEIVKFTSVDFEDPGAQPLTDDELGERPEPTVFDGDFVDPRAWADEPRMTPAATPADLRAFEQRRTSRDAPAPAAPASPPTPVRPSPSKPLGGTTPGRGLAPGAAGRPAPPLPPKGGTTPPTGTRPPTPTATRPSTPSGPHRTMPRPPAPAATAESTPGPETLASLLEPTSPAIPTSRAAGRPGAARSFLIGALIGTVILGGAVAVVVFKRGAAVHAAPQHP